MMGGGDNMWADHEGPPIETLSVSYICRGVPLDPSLITYLILKVYLINSLDIHFSSLKWRCGGGGGGGGKHVSTSVYKL